MEKRPIVLLDIDETILDFHTAEAVAVSRTLRELGIEPTETVVHRYSEINKSQWELLEDGLLTREQVLLRRFQLLFQELGADVRGEEARDRYESYLCRGHWFVPGAPELLETLRGFCRLFVVSNGTLRVQQGRMESAGIGDSFEKVFISEELGVNKPERLFFDRVFAQIPYFDRERAIIVGDSLTSDIRGGRRAGIRSCWFNPEGKPGREDIAPDYEIRTLSELPGLIRKLWPQE